jgi:cellulose synthase/poly-beta-1,6-N-acetylglucosamine synthase-like glycosyltransferase
MISICITAFKEEKTIGKVLSSISNQKISEKFEIIVSCPDEETAAVVKEYMKKHKRIILLRDKGEGKPAALNLIFKKAKGRVLILTDGDVTLGKNSIRNLLKHFKDCKIGAVSGRPIPIINKKSLLFDWANISYRKMHEMRLKESKENTLWHVSGYLYAIRNGIVKEIPKDSLIDDAVIGWIVKSRMHKIAYEPKAIVRVKFPSTLTDFIKQKARVRAGFYQMKKWYGVQPRKLTNELSYGLEHLLRKHSFKNLLSFLLICMVYLFSWIYGWWLIKTQKSFTEIWKRIKSTK